MVRRRWRLLGRGLDEGTEIELALRVLHCSEVQYVQCCSAVQTVQCRAGGHAGRECEGGEQLHRQLVGRRGAL
jgi:hypothetical protein